MIKVQAEDFSVAELYQQLTGAQHTGGVAMFVGLVRDFIEPDTTAKSDPKIGDVSLELEHYPGMTEHNIQAIVREAQNRWPLHKVVVVHRVGKLAPQEQIVFVGVSSAHRAEAFAACDFIMDYLKSRAAFWKKEKQADGSEEWVQAKSTDEESLKRWQ